MYSLNQQYVPESQRQISIDNTSEIFRQSLARRFGQVDTCHCQNEALESVAASRVWISTFDN